LFLIILSSYFKKLARKYYGKQIIIERFLPKLKKGIILNVQDEKTNWVFSPKWLENPAPCN
jgi:hypothetical protein